MAIEFQKGTSLLHSLDARTKLLMFAGATVLAVVIIDPVIMGILFMILYTLGRKAVDKKHLNRNLRVLVVIFATFSMFQIFFFTPDNAHFLFYLIPNKQWVPVTIEGIIRGVAVFFRFFSVVLAVHLMLYTTPPVDMVLAITRRERNRQTWQQAGVILMFGSLLTAIAYLVLPQNIQQIPLSPSLRVLVVGVIAIVVALVIEKLVSNGLPAEMGVALTLGFATVGILSQQTQKITDAQKARGYDVQPKNLIRRVQVLTALLLPIFLATLERSQDIAIAILARGFDYNISARTYRRVLSFGIKDFIVLALIVILLLGGLVLNYFGIGNPIEQLILNLFKF